MGVNHQSIIRVQDILYTEKLKLKSLGCASKEDQGYQGERNKRM